MEFCPRFHESLLPARQRTRDHLHRINTEHSYFILTVRMKVCNMMLGASLDKHADNDPKEPTKLRHAKFYKNSGLICRSNKFVVTFREISTLYSSSKSR